MRYLIIGARGQVGQEFVKLLPSEQVIALGSGDVDVRSLRSVTSCLQYFSGFDTVINLAAYHKVDECEDNPTQTIRVNAQGAHNVARVATALGKKVVFFSTDYVFGGGTRRWHGMDVPNVSLPYDEASPTSPLNVYGASKVAGENLVRIAAPNNHLIIRTSSLFGCTTSKKGSTFPELMLMKARAGEKLRVVHNQLMVPTYTLDLAARVLALLECSATGTYHVTNSSCCSWWEFARATFDLVGMDVEVEAVSSQQFPSKANRPEFSVLSSRRWRRVGMEPLRGWKDALKAYLIEKGEIK